MVGPEDLSTPELKKFHKAIREQYECAINDRIKVEASIILGMIDDELKARGYDVEKLFKDYKKWKEVNKTF